MRIFLSAFWVIVAVVSAWAQPRKDSDLIQFSGVVITGDSLVPVPFTNVLIQNTGRGTMTDYFGYFSFVAHKGDSILFSAVGYRRSYYVIPRELEEQRYSLIQIMTSDTIMLQETVVYPWPTFEDFKQAFLAMEVPETDADRARRNLNSQDMAERRLTMEADASENFKFTQQQYQSRIYYAGQAPPINVLNPFAWSQFIESWQRGDFKKKESRQ